MITEILFVLTLILSAFFSSSETAYISANRFKILVKSQRKDSSRARLLSDDSRYLTTTLVGNNIVMVACSSLAVLVFSPFMPDSLLVLFTTSFLLIFGEVIPKSIAQQIPNRMVHFTPFLMHTFYILFFPVIHIAEWTVQILVVVLGDQRKSAITFFRKMDLPVLVRKYSSQTQINRHEHQLIARAVKIGSKRLDAVMIPRTDIVAVDENMDTDQLLLVFKESGFSRLPVFRQNIDQIVGFVYLLDFLRTQHRIKQTIRPALFLPENTRAINALSQLRNNRLSIALVVDEHGGVAGLVTIEDIIEELFGDIIDEFDDITHFIQVIDSKVLIADGRTKIDDLREKYGFAVPVGEYVTIGGFIMHELGKIPKAGTKIKLSNGIVRVLQSDERRIVKVKLFKIR